MMKPKRLPNRPIDIRTARPQKRVKLFHAGAMDIPFLFLVFLLFAVGITMMYSASYVYALNKTGKPNSYFLRQLMWGALGFIAMWIISKIDYRILNSYWTPVVFFITVLVLLGTFAINIHSEIKRWIKIGSFQFQPSEFAKFALILTMAYLICIFYRVMPVNDLKRRTAPRVAQLTGESACFSITLTTISNAPCCWRSWSSCSAA